MKFTEKLDFDLDLFFFLSTYSFNGLARSSVVRCYNLLVSKLLHYTGLISFYTKKNAWIQFLKCFPKPKHRKNNNKKINRLGCWDQLEHKKTKNLKIKYVYHKSTTAATTTVLCVVAMGEVGYFLELFTVMYRTNKRMKREMYWEWNGLANTVTVFCVICAQLMSSANIHMIEVRRNSHNATKLQLPHGVTGTHSTIFNTSKSNDWHLELQFESNSSSTSDYTYFFTKPSRIWCYGCCCCYSYPLSFAFGRKSKTKATKPWTSKIEWAKEREIDFEETKTKLILDIGQFEKCFESIFIYKWGGPDTYK